VLAGAAALALADGRNLNQIRITNIGSDAVENIVISNRWQSYRLESLGAGASMRFRPEVVFEGEVMLTYDHEGETYEHYLTGYAAYVFFFRCAATIDGAVIEHDCGEL